MLLKTQDSVDFQSAAQYALAAMAQIQRLDSQDSAVQQPKMFAQRELNHFDSWSAGQLQEQLTYYHPELIRQEFPEYKYANGLVPIDAREYIGVETIKRTRVTRTGQWKRSSEGTPSLAPIDVGIDDVDYGKVPFDAKVTFTTEELERIEFARANRSMGLVIDTVQEKLRAVNEAYQQLINRILASGSPRDAVYGLHNHPGITRVRSPYKMGLSVTPEENIAILTDMLRTVSRQSGQRSFFNGLIMPDQLSIDLSQQMRNSAGAQSTLDSFRTSPAGRRINIATTPEADNAGPGGTTILHGYRVDASRLQGCIPKRMRQVAPAYYMNGVYCAEFKCVISGTHLVRPYDHVQFYDVYDVN